MIKRFSDGLEKFARGWIVVAAFIVMFLFPIVIFPLAGAPGASQDASSIDLKFSYPPEEVYRIIGEFGEEGRRISIRTHLTVDILYPIAYAFAYGLLITYFSRRIFPPESWLQRLNLLPFLTLLADYAENFGVALLINAYPDTLNGLARLTSLATSLKWLLVAAMTIWVIIGLMWLALDRLILKRK